MKDKNGKELKIGDWALYCPEYPEDENNLRVGRISKIEDRGAMKGEVLNTGKVRPAKNFFAAFYYRDDRMPWWRESFEIEKISDEEAMIYILEI